MKKSVLDLCNMTPVLTKRLNEIAQNYRKIFTDFIDQLSLKYKDNLYWWITPLASREITLCDCFYDFCLLKLAIEEIKEKKPVNVIVPKLSMKHAIRKNIDTRGILFTVNENKKEIIKKKFKYLYALYSINLLRRKVKAVQKGAGIRDLSKLADKVILIDTYAIPSQLKNGVYIDRYFCGLVENTDENIIFLVQLDFDNIQDGQRLAKALTTMDNILLFEQFVEKNDFNYVKKYYYQCSKFKFNDCKIEKLDVSDLVKDAIKVGSTNITSMYGILKGNTVCRLIEKYKVCVKALIGWYEGQPSSNGMFKIVRKKFSYIPTISYVLSPCQENNLALYPSKLQVKEKCISEFYGVQGSSWMKLVRQFDNTVKCVLAPSFRYQSVYDINYQQLEFGGTKQGILLVLSYFVESSRQLLRCFFEATKELKDFDVEIKNHPVNDKYLIKDYDIVDDEYSHLNIRFVSGKMSDVVKEKEMVILCDSTSCLEIMLSGVFTVSFMSGGKLSCLCLPEDSNIENNIAYDTEDLKRFIEIRHDMEPSVKELKLLREKTFVRVNRNTVAEFLEQKIMYEEEI